jgi:hypothetical protein
VLPQEDIKNRNINNVNIFRVSLASFIYIRIQYGFTILSKREKG